MTVGTSYRSREIQIQRILNEIENYLSGSAAIPGSLAGTFKILLGGTQLVVAISVLPAYINSGSLRRHSFTHIIHGLGNIVGGTLEAIPFVGSVMYLIRLLPEQFTQMSGGSVAPMLYTGQDDKFMAYKRLRCETAELYTNLDTPEYTGQEALEQKEERGALNLRCTLLSV